MNSPLFGQLISSWATAMWSASWQGAMGFAVVYLICRTVPRLSPATQCWLWRFAYLKLLLSLIWAAPLHLPTGAPHALVAIAGPNYDALSELGRPATIDAPVTTALRASTAGVALFLLWVAGCGWFLRRVIIEVRDTRRLRAACREIAEPGLASACSALSGEMVVSQPKLMEHDGPGVPILVGLKDVAIVLPGSFRDDYDEEQVRMIIAHELAHLKRADLKWAWLARLARCAFFFHPLVWLAEHEWQQSQEMACDQEVLRLDQVSRSSYGAILLQVVQQRGAFSSSGLAVMQVVESYSTVKRRLIAMKRTGFESRFRLMAAGTFTCATAVIALVPWRVVAQEPSKAPNGESATFIHNGQLFTGKIADALNLTSIQQAKIRAIHESAIAQVRRTLTQQQVRRLDQMAANSKGAAAMLSLTRDQEERLTALKQEMGAKAEAIQANNALSQQQKEEALRQLKESHEKVFMSVLTPQQMDEAKRMHELKGADQGPAYSPEQQEHLSRLKGEFVEAASHIEHDSTLSPQEKKARMEPLARHMDEEVHRILTPEQLAQMHHRKAIEEAGPYSPEAIAGLGDLTPAQKQRLETIHRDLQKRLMAALTPTQREKLAQLHQNR